MVPSSAVVNDLFTTDNSPLVNLALALTMAAMT
jgi:hypothetical protein